MLCRSLQISNLGLVYAICSVLSIHYASAQDKIVVKQADFIRGSNQRNVQRLIHDVIVTHEDTELSADSMHLYNQEDRVIAYGNVHVNQDDSVHLYSDSLSYYSTDELATAYQNVELRDSSMTLYTDLLYYDRIRRIANYPENGRVEDSTNFLTSIEGVYIVRERKSEFYRDVHLVNPRYEIFTDTLYYYTETKQSFFRGYTLIISEDGDSIHSSRGMYDARSEDLYFSERAEAIFDSQTLEADSIYYDRITKKGSAYGNVIIVDSTQTTYMYGERAFFDNNKNDFLLLDKPYMIQVNGEDSLYMHSDTIYGYMEEDSSKVANFYPGVRFYSEQMQGVADTVRFEQSLHRLHMITQPAVWLSNGYQMTAVDIFIKLTEDNNSIDSLKMLKKAMIVQPEEKFVAPDHYNQLQGRNIYGLFDSEGEIKRMDVLGNAHAVYYASEQEPPHAPIGMNDIISSKIKIYFVEREVQRFVFITQPDAVFYPSDQIPKDKKILNGFLWRGDQRPISKDDVFRTDKNKLPPLEITQIK